MEHPKSLMLKDYLKDYELSSCSSNGFRSFPRRPCCTTTTIRFLIEFDLKVKDSSSSLTKRFLRRNSSRKLAFTAVSKAVIRTFKQLPFPSVNRSRLGFLPRSLSRKLLPRSFWKREECEYTVGEPEPEVRRWKSFQEFLDDDKEFTVDRNPTVVRNSTSSSSHSNNSNSWTESEFTSSVDSENYGENNVGKGGEDSNLIDSRDREKVGEDLMEEATIAVVPEEIAKQWPSDEEEKEQFSPVSVLDFPFEHISSSSFNSSLLLIEGKKQKMKRFDQNKAGVQLEPINLQKRFEDQENQIETKAYELLKLVQSTTNSPCFIFQTENLLLDFFHEKLDSADRLRHRLSDIDYEEQVLKLTEDWINNNNGRGMVEMEWGLEEEGRKMYLKDMEKNGNWGDFGEGKKELVLEFEGQVWISLLNELLFDLS